MHCPRCKGLTLMERFFDYRDDSGQIDFTGWRCLVCGEILGPVIAGNRHVTPWKADHTRAGMTRAYSKIGQQLSSIRVPVPR